MLTVVLLYPDLLGTYGDGGNATILARRLQWRGYDAEVLTVRSSDPVPAAASFYVLGGGEDLPQALAARQLALGTPLSRAVAAGAAVLAVCAGLQILGTRFIGPDGATSAGLGLVDAVTTRGQGPRAVGELVVDPDAATGLPTLTGYENHGGVTSLGPGTRPLGTVRVGVGNGAAGGGVGNGAAGGGVGNGAAGGGVGNGAAGGGVGNGAAGGGVGNGAAGDGFIAGRIVATYLHGPVLARNPALADHLLASVVGPLEALDDADSDELRRERLASATSGRRASRPEAFGRAGREAAGRWRSRVGSGARR